MKPKKPNYKIDEISLVLVVAIIAIAVSFYEYNKKPVPIGAEKITGLLLDSHDISFASGGVIDSDKLKEVQKMDYIQLKNRLNVKEDFCMYIEDENGNIILAKGSAKLIKDGIICEE